MIYWERVHSRFEVVLQRHGLYVWEWQRPEGWVDWRESDHATVPQWAGDQTSGAALLRERLQPFENFSSFLVIYSESGLRCSIGLITSTDSRALQRLKFGTTPPSWWFYDEEAGITSPLAVFLARVQGQLAALREAYDFSTREGRTLAPLLAKHPNGTHCPRCGLPYLKHVTHEIPGFVKPESGPLETWRPYLHAFRKHYQGALKRLTDDEITAMILPTSSHYLKVLAIEVQRRIENPTPIKGRYDLLLEQDSLDEAPER